MDSVRAFLHDWRLVLLIIHVGVTAAMIVVILLQRSEGGGLGMGRTDALFSVRGQANVLSRMTAIFGNATKGMRAASLGPAKFDRDDPLYVSTLRTTRCDSSGSFSFQRIPDGGWYVTTSVKWQGAGASQAEGGSVMQRVDVHGAKLVKVSLP